VVVVPRSLREAEAGTPTPGREKLGVCERAGEEGETGSTTSVVAAGLFVFRGRMPSIEFRFGERAGGGGMPSASVVGLSAGLGLVPRVFVGLSAARGGIGRPPVVLGLRGMAGSSASVRGGGMAFGCCCAGACAGGGANCCTC